LDFIGIVSLVIGWVFYRKKGNVVIIPNLIESSPFPI
jgi:hypothetical protein